MYPIETRDVNQVMVLSVSRRVRLTELPEFIPESGIRLFGELNAQNALRLSPPSGRAPRIGTDGGWNIAEKSG
jgi:hypothetical protein